MTFRTLLCTAAAFALLGAPAAFAQAQDSAGGQYGYQSGGHHMHGGEAPSGAGAPASGGGQAGQGGAGPGMTGEGSMGQGGGHHETGETGASSAPTAAPGHGPGGTAPGAVNPGGPMIPAGHSDATQGGADHAHDAAAAAPHEHVMAGSPAAAQGPRFTRGQVMPEYYRNGVYRVSDWKHYHLHRPKDGYRWIRVDGQFYLIKEKTGMIEEHP